MNNKQPTKNRIKASALSLFNTHGAHSTTTNHIAAELGMSPGNLYYHYASKQDIIREIFGDIASDFSQLWSPDEAIQFTPDGIKKIFAKFSDLYFNYRFFYIELPTLLDQDSHLRKLYHKNEEIKMVKIRTVIDHLISEKIMNSFTDEAEIDAWIENCWILSDFRLSHFEISGRKISKESIDDGMKKFAFFLFPYLTKKGRTVITSFQ